MQLKFYARSGQAIGVGQDLAEVYYALNGVYVSNVRELKTSICISDELSEPSSTTFHTTDVELISPDLLVPYYAMFVISFVVYWLIMITANRLIEGEAIVDDQSLPFLIGFLVCTSMFGVVVTLTEMIYFPWRCLLSAHVILGIVCLLGIFATLPLILLLAMAFIKVCHKGNCNFSDFSRIFVCAFLSTFLFLWLFICGFPTLLLCLGYPLETLSLVVLHVAFVFAVTVALAVVLNDAIFWWNCYYIKRSRLLYQDRSLKPHNYIILTKTNGQKKKKCSRQIFAVIDVIKDRIHMCIIIIVVLSVGCLAYVVIMFGYAVTVVQGFVNSGGPSAVVSLFPSLVLFLIGWLIKNRFIADTGKAYTHQQKYL